MNRKLLLFAALLLIVAFAGGLFLFQITKEAPSAVVAVIEAETPAPAETEEWIVTVVEPGCVSAGYTMREHRQTGVVEIEDGAPATGHAFGEWIVDPETGMSVQTCAICGDTLSRLPETASDLPSIRLTGSTEGMSKDDRVLLNVEFFDGAGTFSGYAYTSWQGHSTLVNEKKNYTIRLFDDEALTVKHRMELRPGWHLEHKYVLKANYADVSQARNLIAARLWSRMTASRDNLNARLARTSNYGAVDGFPVTVWLNGEFHGLYTLCLHKDDDLYDMHEGNRDVIMICNDSGSDEAFFRAPAAFEENASSWEIEFSAEEEEPWVKESFNALIRFVMESDDETFRTELSRHLDVDSAIDYLLFMYAAGLTDSAAKDLVLLSYEGGPWIASAYDMEDAFGLSADGASALAADAFLPGKQDGAWTSGTGSLLWDRLLGGYEDRIRARWQALRQDVLNANNLIAEAEALLSAVPDGDIRTDLNLYPGRTPIENPEEQILTYIRERMPLLDEIFGGAQT